MTEEKESASVPQEADDVRRKALLRLSVAGVVTAAALAGLWFLDQEGGAPPAKTVPTPIVMAPAQESAPPQPPAGETVPALEPQQETDGQFTAAKPAPEEALPPPPKVSNAKSRPSHARPVVPHQASAVLAHEESHGEVHEAAPQAVAPRFAARPAERYVVQLGVFSDPEHARELVEKLNKEGIRAHMETRVQLGPFDKREDAERARVEMLKLGMRALVTPAATMK